MYKLPQEIEVWYIIPRLRKELAKEFISKYKLSYEKAGNILGISKAAISQYLSNKRANKIKLSKEIIVEVKKSAEVMIQNPHTAIKEMERLLAIMRQKRCSCDVCKHYNKDVLKYCNCDPKY